MFSPLNVTLNIIHMNYPHLETLTCLVWLFLGFALFFILMPICEGAAASVTYMIEVRYLY